MKILLKEKILGILSSFEEANDYFDAAREKSKILGVCITCQETAQTLGEIIGQNEKNSQPVLKCLMDYYELIYSLYMAEEDGWRNILGSLKEQVECLKEHVKNDLAEEKMKAAFFPYSASMWDAFESICDCARQDDRFQVNVIPIPYFSLGSNGEAIEEHYEGEQIAAFTKITDYRQYDMERERPDVVFIHNPYDQHNLVTRIHSSYFSSKLIKYTPHLVYIPYYISKVKTMDNMIGMPGVQNAWRIFVDSELVRQQYIECGIDEAKVIASGSPKFDMVFQAMKKYTKIPAQWKVLEGKKIFFYNTHLHGIINEGGLFIDNIHYIFEYFQKRPDIGLLWRPHPLSIETIKAMNPGILRDYMKLVEEIKAGSFGVYDDTAELERSIAISHGYIGEDISSVSRLYEATGKPMYYVENYNSNLTKQEKYARSLCAECCNGMIYMYSWNCNRIFIVNEETGDIRWDTGNEAYGEGEQNLYIHSVQDGKHIYFIPYMASSVMKYNTGTGEKCFMEIGTGAMNYYPLVSARKLYLLPIYYAEFFFVLNLDTDEMERLSMTHLTQRGKYDKGVPLFYGSVQARGCIWRACQLGPYVQKYDPDKATFQYIKVNGLEQELRGITYDGTYFWCIPLMGNKIYQWDSVQNKIVRIITVNELSHLQRELLFSDLQCVDRSVWIFLRILDCMVKVDVDSGKVHILDYSSFITHDNHCRPTQMFSGNVKISKNNIYMFPFKANGILKTSLETEEITYQETKLNQKDLLDGMTGNTLNESICNLELFFRRLETKSSDDKRVEIKFAGSEIWNHITRDL